MSIIKLKIIGGGQTGADQAGWRAAKRFGLETGGWMPKGFLTEEGKRPEFAELYGAKEHKSASYVPRRRLNIEESDATIIFAIDPKSPGSMKTVEEAYELEKPNITIKVYGDPGKQNRIEALAGIWLSEVKPKVINIAGNRESKFPGVGDWTEKHLAALFRHLGFKEIGREDE